MHPKVKLSFVSLLLTVIMLVIYQKGYSQVHFGLRTGLTASKLQKGDRFSWKPSGYGGVYGQIQLNEKFFLRPEWLYTLDVYTDKWNTSMEYRGFRLDCLRLPVLLGSHLGKHFEVVLGPELSWVIKAQRKYGTSDMVDVSKYFNKQTYGIASGTSYLANKRFGIDMHFNHDFTRLKESIEGDSDNPVLVIERFNYSALQLGVHVIL